jgi:hypothetical protein
VVNSIYEYCLMYLPYCWCLFEFLLFHLDVVKVHFLATFLSSFVPIFLFFILSLHLIFPFSIPKYFSFKIDYMDAKKNPYYMCQESQWWKMWMLIHHKCFYFMFCVCFYTPPQRTLGWRQNPPIFICSWVPTKIHLCTWRFPYLWVLMRLRNTF